ncbi:MAG: hypothetical protein QXJ74_00725 [Nitrososphaera sp.]
MERPQVITSSAWSARFMTAAIVQGAAIVALTAVLVLGQTSFMKPEVSRVIAAGGAGTWFTFGFVIYIVVGVVGVAVSALFYQSLGNRVPKILGWLHLVLMNAGVAAAAGMMMYAGYVGGAAALPEAVGGAGFNQGQVHGLIVPFVEPIGASILVLLAGVLAGGAGYLMAYRRSSGDKTP